MDRFATHLEILQKIFEFKKIKSVIEFGLGHNSTTFFIDKVEKLTSVEMQSEEWYNIMYNLYKSRNNWIPLKLLGPSEIFKIDYEKVDLIFVDGHGDTRYQCVNFMSKYSDIIVAHDTEAEKVYNWNLVDLKDYKQFTDRRNEPWTTVWTKDEELMEFLQKNINSPAWYKCYLNGIELN